MGLRLVGALLLAVALGGCTDTHGLFGSSENSDYAMVAPQPVAAPQPQADPSFRVTELRVGLTKAQLEAMYPRRLALDTSDASNALYFVEPLGLTPRSVVQRDRLVLWLKDGKLATFDVVRSNESVAVANVSAAPPVMATGSIPSYAKFGVQIAASRSEADARALIDTMRAKYPDQLKQLSARIARVSLPEGVFYRVVIGPLGSEQQASQLCSSLKAQGAECFLRGV